MTASLFWIGVNLMYCGISAPFDSAKSDANLYFTPYLFWGAPKTRIARKLLMTWKSFENVV